MAPQVMWIGLGNMGRGMCKNLVEKGPLDSPLLLFNRTKKRSDDLSAKLGTDKTEALSSIEDGVKRADIVFTCLSNDAAVEEAYAAILRAGNLKGKLVVDCSTIHPDATEKTAKIVVDAGAEFVASPIFGPPANAEAGQLLFIPAGPKASIARLRPYTTGVMGIAEIPFEDKPYASSSKLKLIGNTFILNMVTQLAEGLTMAEKTEVGTEPVQQFIKLLFGGVHAAYADRMVQGTYHKMDEPLFSANNALKDAGHAINLAEAAGMVIRNTETAAGYLKDVAKHVGGDKGDIAGIYGAARMDAGLKYENDA
ncbi:NAD binding domain of 6-phosphogluconate dehydrogenase-domain-containing protein [Pseudomassariella vexata]|uniref:NAD binding domain of 6-phosphogluconate dehydrogenase-domain-containing protein n=1 Tax=Pseudomassariella vexata TaxID=1141098 RepID=A0A1Y2DV70_9PEZI|nr:NAD binding domain of 6-phosphogluconate dehydrogenase-domain-containing protein [Pseudomassariella vexata]ORY63089.1 NAD binding domain of 6-phosphogluconate dehydrogenase-domain-containing protein [Pseudomassariella vexata]